MDQGAASARAQAWRAVAATLGACLVVTLVGWAALIGPSQVFTGPGPTPSQETTTTSEAPIDEVEEKDRDDVAAREYGPTTTVVANLVGGAIQVLTLAGMLLVAYLAVRRGLTAWRLRRRYDAPVDADFETLEGGAPERVRQAIADDTDEQLRLLLDGEPRNAIVACWHRFELQAVDAGLPRHPWETSSEFALRMLERAEVDSTAVASLLELYREARFSEHALDEAHRERAATALRAIQGQVQVRQRTVGREESTPPRGRR
ncbi:DUF4129 domain-containing protein [Nocardioides currus]|uniref:Protein-glutamine gamma-glutamyltransferase-like C-terminal domain-containing protein n=1 Tax=Nocardioides currus TaxID=2133958 RepID=A0A2R7Z1I5_9ACTN|nr:DUF4129 domain-containing protein [Nocardioides currus]PUA82009.1 hypothetical protein C7S10_08210 [Nocardioides currus]